MKKIIEKIINRDIDKSDMQRAIANFPKQIDKSFNIMQQWSPINLYSDIENILLLGMGGSAIGGDVAKVIVQNSCSVPIIINRSYLIPEWVNSKTLIIASSYSGNTEETLSAFSKCKSRKCSILVLSAGGKLTDYAIDMGLDIITIPGGYQPRAAIGYSFTLIVLILKRLGFISDTIVKHVKDSIAPLEKLCTKLIK